MSYLPLFIDVTGKKCLVVGGGKVASRKLIPILSTNMSVTLISPDVNDEIHLKSVSYTHLRAHET